MNSFNAADVVVIAIIAICTYFYYKKGLVSTLLGFLSTLFSVILSRILSPFLADFLKKTSLFDNIKDYIVSFVFSAEESVKENIIQNLNLPDFLKDALVDNNNSVVYEKLNVSNIQDYISEYIASFIINIIAMIILFVILFILFKFLAKTLNLISKLPIIKTANKLCGGVLGFAQGVIIIWIGLAILTMFYGKPAFSDINDSVANSLIASKFYDTNIIIKGLSSITNLI